MKVRLSPLPNTKALRTPVFNCGTAQRFEFVVRFLRKRLQLKDHESVFCYVNSVFAPGLDEGVGNLWRVSLASSEALYYVRVPDRVLMLACSASKSGMSWWLVTALRRLLGEDDGAVLLAMGASSGSFVVMTAFMVLD